MRADLSFEGGTQQSTDHSGKHAVFPYEALASAQARYGLLLERLIVK